MTPRKSSFLFGIPASLLLLSGAARADCLPIDAFNQLMADDGTMVPEATITMVVAGVNPEQFPKGAFFGIGDDRCDIGSAEIALKIYGTAGVGIHPPGSLKMEFNNRCGQLHRGDEAGAFTSDATFPAGAGAEDVAWVRGIFRPGAFGYSVWSGCRWSASSCEGQPLACDTAPGPVLCDQIPGCSWDEAGCLGFNGVHERSCGNIVEQGTCNNQTGGVCEWTSNEVCRPVVAGEKFDCRDIAFATRCDDHTSGACVWDFPGPCEGDAVACEGRDETSCESPAPSVTEASGTPNAELLVNRVTLLNAFGAFDISNTDVQVLSAQVCFDTTVPASRLVTFRPSDTATASEASPAQPYPGDDLVVGPGFESYFSFDVNPMQGKVLRSWLFTWTLDQPEASGGPVQVHAVSGSWDESSLAWSDRPASSGAVLDLVDEHVQNASYAYDVTSAVAAEGRHGFALKPGPGSVDDVRMHARQAGGVVHPPALLVEYEVHDGDSDGYPDGPDCDDGDPEVNPGADEACNGVDDDCDGVTDEGCGAGGAGGGAPDAGQDGGGLQDAGSDAGDGAAEGGGRVASSGGEGSGCACRFGSGRSLAGGWIALLCGFRLWTRVRRRRRADQP